MKRFVGYVIGSLLAALIFAAVREPSTSSATHDSIFSWFNADADAGAQVQWKPFVDFGGEIFPSYIVATRRTENWKTSRNPTFGDAFGTLGASVVSATPGTRVTLEISAPELPAQGRITAVLSEPGKRYELLPKIAYDDDRLLARAQARNINISYKLYVGDELAAETTFVARVRAPSEVPFVAVDHEGARQDLSWMYTAFVNENHPWVDGILKEALKSGLVRSFKGYQGSPEEVQQEVFAIWNVLQRFGVRYSNVTIGSAVNSKVGGQRVRTFHESIRNEQANCVDGTVLFASLLRAIGVDPVLVIRPGHMYLGYYLGENRTGLRLLETTALGSADLRKYPESSHSGEWTRNAVSWHSFQQAQQRATAMLRGDWDHVQKKEYGYRMIDVEHARKVRIDPVPLMPSTN